MAVGANVGVKHGRSSRSMARRRSGKDKVNPIAMVLAVKEGLEWLGQQKDDARLGRGAAAIEAAVIELLKGGAPLTYDLVGEAKAAKCSEVGQWLAEAAVRHLG
jgi:isocitrate/isopropylmalate dehydrogenase